jgi:hypothetical protein
MVPALLQPRAGGTDATAFEDSRTHPSGKVTRRRNAIVPPASRSTITLVDVEPRVACE